MVAVGTETYVNWRQDKAQERKHTVSQPTFLTKERRWEARKTDTRASADREANERNCTAPEEGRRDLLLKSCSGAAASQLNPIS